MSIQAVSWVLDHSPTRGAKRLVLISLANHADDEGYCWPSHATVAREAGVAVATAKRTIAELAEDGAITREVNAAPDERIRKDRRPNLYRLVMSTGGTDDAPRREAPTAPPATERGAQSRRDGGHNHDATGGTDDAPKPSVEPSGEPSTSSASDEIEQQFEIVWEAYPKRNGKRERKAAALTQFRRLSLDDRRAAWRGACNYAAAVAAGATIAADCFRWLRDRRWEDWQVPAEISARNGRAGVHEHNAAVEAQVLGLFGENDSR